MNLQRTDLNLMNSPRHQEEKIYLSAAFEITLRCNFRCAHCYIEEKDRIKINLPELSFREIARIIDKLVDFGCLYLLLTGGEPLIRDDFLDIYVYAKKKGLLVDIFTNAALITNKHLDLFSHFPPHMIQISLYSITEDVFESLTQMHDIFETVYNNVELLCQKGIRVQFAFPILELNKGDFSKVRQFAYARQINLAYNPIMFPPLNGANRLSSFVISPEEAVNFDLIDKDRLKSWQGTYQRFLTLKRLPVNISCKSGVGESMPMQSVIINSQGEWDVKRYFPCLPHNYSLLESANIKQIYKLFLEELDSQRRHTKCLCKRCKYLTLCGRCFKLTNPKDKKTWYFCKIAREREKRLGAFKKTH